MVLVDEYSRFPIVEIIRSVSANTVIPVLDKHLATFGYPDVIESDNGAPFNSDAFASFAKHSGFRHRRVTECWPRGNAQAEGFNKPLLKAIRSAVVEQRNWKQEVCLPIFATIQSNATHFYQVQSTPIAVRQTTWHQTTTCFNRRQPRQQTSSCCSTRKRQKGKTVPKDVCRQEEQGRAQQSSRGRHGPHA